MNGYSTGLWTHEAYSNTEKAISGHELFLPFSIVYTKSDLKRSPRFSRLSLATPFDGVFETPKSNSPKGLVGHCLLFWFFFFRFLIWPLNSFILFLLFHSFMSLSWRLVSLKQRVQLPPLPTLSVNGSRFWIVYQILFSLYFIWIVYANGIAWESPSSRSLAAEPLFFFFFFFLLFKKMQNPFVSLLSKYLNIFFLSSLFNSSIYLNIFPPCFIVIRAMLSISSIVTFRFFCMIK